MSSLNIEYKGFSLYKNLHDKYISYLIRKMLSNDKKSKTEFYAKKLMNIIRKNDWKLDNLYDIFIDHYKAFVDKEFMDRVNRGCYDGKFCVLLDDEVELKKQNFIDNFATTSFSFYKEVFFTGDEVYSFRTLVVTYMMSKGDIDAYSLELSEIMSLWLQSCFTYYPYSKKKFLFDSSLRKRRFVIECISGALIHTTTENLSSCSKVQEDYLEKLKLTIYINVLNNKRKEKYKSRGLEYFPGVFPGHGGRSAYTEQESIRIKYFSYYLGNKYNELCNIANVTLLEYGELKTLYRAISEGELFEWIENQSDFYFQKDFIMDRFTNIDYEDFKKSLLEKSLFKDQPGFEYLS